VLYASGYRFQPANPSKGLTYLQDKR